MDIFAEFTGFILIFWLLVSIFRVIASSAERYIDISELIFSTRQANQRIPSSNDVAKITEDGSEILAHKNR